ncbi:FAD/NAD(P)-binding protein [Streptomyces sp. A1-5]|uniref:FAD/NAD(P)-binding protein n=1 Tax=Streptomyces sp. A1-5 TaxID=2738410 RepID=UPI001F1FBBF3|nr:FAD/NAD(P)-binding protein [Streptomyces sp. A1-5]UJB46186.1 FAD/NAD(P)-binding protein [Streptomyces sp. A1-5]
MTAEPGHAVCVIGCGPRGASVVERILANSPALLDGAPLTVHVVDPWPPGAGRTWRTDQPALLWMNSTAEQVTMFPGAGVKCAGPARPGPTTGQWLTGPLHDGAYASRADQGRYLRWFFEQVTAEPPAGVDVLTHRASVVDLLRTGDGRQRVVLDGGLSPIDVDHVVMALGHPHNRSASHWGGIPRIGPGPADPERLAAIAPGERVVVRGLGLVFTDCLALLTQGRGGRFVRREGRLRYLPSGREPHLIAGSRRGVPLPPRVTAPFTSPRPPRFATLAACRERLGRAGARFDRDVWPLMLAELAWSHYQALFALHPERTRMTWAAFDAEFALFVDDDDRREKLVRAAVPEDGDRLDLARLEAPLSGVEFSGAQELQDHVRGYLRDALRRRGQGQSTDLAVVGALGSVGAVVEEMWRGGELSPQAVAQAWERFTFGAFLSSGPPPLRSEQLLALSEQGIVTFVGSGMTVQADPGRGVVRARSEAVPAVHEGTVLLDAYLEKTEPERVENPLLKALLARGELVEEQVEGAGTGTFLLSGAQLHPIDADGIVQRDRAVLGPAQFPRADTDAAFFRQTDAVARQALAGNLRGADTDSFPAT